MALGGGADFVSFSKVFGEDFGEALAGGLVVEDGIGLEQAGGLLPKGALGQAQDDDDVGVLGCSSSGQMLVGCGGVGGHGRGEVWGWRGMAERGER